MRMEPKLKWVWIIVLSWLVWFIANSDACWEDERIALLRLKPFFNDTYYNILNDWVEVKDSDCCVWHRVECNSTTKRVVSLSLESLRDNKNWRDPFYLNELRDNMNRRDRFYLNVSLFLPFFELNNLSLMGNNIAGFIGDHEGLGKLPSTLEFLYLLGNQLNDSILSTLSRFSSLKVLDLSHNQFTGSSDRNGFKQLSRLDNLEALNLGGNYLNNSILPQLSSLSSLKKLWLWKNNLEGTLHIQGLNNLINLKMLHLAYNKIESLRSFQDSGRQLKFTHLEELYLNENLLNNSVFASLSGLSNLKSLDLSGNRLKGPIHMTENKSSTKLRDLYLDSSIANGSNILQSIGALTSLETLYLSYSGLTGTLPNQGWCDLRNLKLLAMTGNELAGKLPSCLGNLTSLQVLDISDNQLPGDLTPLANLRSLRALLVSQNYFQVPLLFLSISNLTDLKILLSDDNKLMMETVSYTSIPKFQLEIISLSKCATGLKPLEELTKYLYYQHDLRFVDLSHNNFIGTVPFWLLENNKNIEALLMQGNSLTGPLLLPPLPNLHLSVLDMSSNNIQGQVPTGICSTFLHLEELFLSNNALEGDIPPCLGGMSFLSVLDLSSNQLSGGVPNELTMNSSLTVLRLSKNNLSGKMIPSIFKSYRLLRLYLNGNDFVGEIPEIDVQGIDIRFLSFSDIDLSNNSLVGKIPRWMWNLPYLRSLALSNNHFEGSISTDLCSLGQLYVLDLAQNNLSGSIPSCFNPPFIRHVHLSRNKLSGFLNYGFFNSSSLVTLDLSENNLTGNIPEWIGTFSELSVLLKANNLDGKIPVQLCKLYSLSLIDFSHNMLSGPIPSCLGNLTLGLEYGKSSVLDGYIQSPLGAAVEKYSGVANTTYSRNSSDYPGSYMEEWVEFTTKSASYSYKGNILEYMSGIDLSCNNLTGQIPLELGNLSELHSLNLSHNNLTGVIPSSFSNLKKIESMDISYNNLAGEIPKQLVELNSLEVFSVAYNNLSGTTPEPKAQFGTFDESSYEGNLLLCGPPLPYRCSNIDSPPTVSTASDEEEGNLLDKYVFCVSFLVAYVAVLMVVAVVLYINPYWRQLWFYFIEDFIDACRYSIVGNFIELYIIRRCG